MISEREKYAVGSECVIQIDGKVYTAQIESHKINGRGEFLYYYVLIDKAEEPEEIFHPLLLVICDSFSKCLWTG